MDNFPFLKLPLVAKSYVIERIRPMDLFELSLTSQATFILLKSFRLNATLDVLFDGEFMRFSVQNSYGLPSNVDFEDYNYKGIRVPREFDNCAFTGTYKTNDSIGFKNGVNTVLDRLFSLYSPKLNVLQLVSRDCFEENYSNFANLLLNVEWKNQNNETQIVCDTLKLSREYANGIHNFESLLDNLIINKSVDVLTQLDTSHPKIFSAPRLHVAVDFPNRIEWFTADILCEQVLVEESEWTDSTFNELIHLWNDGKMPNMKCFEIRIHDDGSGDAVSNLDNLHRNLAVSVGDSKRYGRSFEVPGTQRTIDCVGGYEIEREDGKVCTIIRRSWYFAFVVWN